MILMEHNYNVLLNSNSNNQFNELGYTKLGRISDKLIKELITLNNTLSIPDYFNCGFNVGMNTDIKSLRKSMQDNLNSILSHIAQEYLNDFEIYTASFLNKLNREDCFVIAHQDFTYTNEQEYPSFMCFIPLVDTTINNAALGFIPKSHKFFNYIRAFPFPQIPSPVTENSIELMRYFDIIELKAGEMVFFMHNTIHGSFSNYSNELRPAIGLSFIKKGINPNLFIHNPKTKGKTLLKFEVDKYSLVEYNNPILKSMYQNGTIDLPYKLLDEIEYKLPETSWDYVKGYLDCYNIHANTDYDILIKNYNNYLLNKSKSNSKILSIFNKILRKNVVS
jgi:hypothetical protein